MPTRTGPMPAGVTVQASPGAGLVVAPESAAGDFGNSAAVPLSRVDAPFRSTEHPQISVNAATSNDCVRTLGRLQARSARRFASPVPRRGTDAAGGNGDIVRPGDVDDSEISVSG